MSGDTVGGKIIEGLTEAVDMAKLQKENRELRHALQILVNAVDSGKVRVLAATCHHADLVLKYKSLCQQSGEADGDDH